VKRKEDGEIHEVKDDEGKKDVGRIRKNWMSNVDKDSPLRSSLSRNSETNHKIIPKISGNGKDTLGNLRMGNTKKSSQWHVSSGMWDGLIKDQSIQLSVVGYIINTCNLGVCWRQESRRISPVKLWPLYLVTSHL